MIHYINTAAADPALARTVSLTNLSPAPFPAIAYGDSASHTFVFHSRGTVESWSGAAGNSLRLTIAEIGGAPTDGEYSLMCGTSAPNLPFGANAGTLTAALNTLPTVAAEGGVDVSGEFPDFLIAWRTVGVKSAITADVSWLIPECTATFTTLLAGGVAACQRVALSLRREPIATVTEWTAVTSPANGWTGTIDTSGAAALFELVTFGTKVGELLQAPVALTLEHTKDGKAQTVYQVPILLRAKT